MEILRIPLPEDIKSIIDRQVAEGHAATQADYVTAALRLYADHLDTEDEIASIVARTDDDIAAGRYVTVTTAAESDALHDAAMARLRARLAADDSAA
jgi:Arc/MetJ-type ribon-helix-helix transcriptional regulator